MQFEVRNRFTGAVQFVAEIECAEDADVSRKLGLAVKWAVKAGADLAGADLAGANLTDANLTSACLAGANLAGADFAWANLVRANLVRANLTDANLASADLADANLTSACLAGACLAGANLIHAGTRSDGYGFYVQKRKDVTWIKAGCRYMPLVDARAFWADKHRDEKLTAETMALIDNAERLVAIRWPAKAETQQAA